MKGLAKYLDDGHNFRTEQREEDSLVRSIYSGESGFTLLELMVTIVVSVVLIGIAIPSYRGLIVSNRLTATTNEFVAGINMAKLEAIRRNVTVQFCARSSNGGDALGIGCTAGGPGAVYFLDGSIATPVYVAPIIRTDINLFATVGLRFNGQGLAKKVGDTAPYTGLLLDVSSDQIRTNNHRCIYITTGSTISSCSYTSTSGGCPTSEPTTCQ